MAQRRSTEWLNRKQASNFLAAHRFADRVGRPLNLAVVLNFAHTNCAPEAVSEAFERLRDTRFTRWLRYRSQKAMKAGKPEFGPPTYAWVVEAKDGIVHVNWSVHLPASLLKDFRKALQKWFAEVGGGVVKAEGAVHDQAIYGSNGWARYCMKGIDPHHAKKLYIDPTPQGTVIGKRCGVSVSIGPGARRLHRMVEGARSLPAAPRPSSGDALPGPQTGVPPLPPPTAAPPPDLPW